MKNIKKTLYISLVLIVTLLLGFQIMPASASTTVPFSVSNSAGSISGYYVYQTIVLGGGLVQVYIPQVTVTHADISIDCPFNCYLMSATMSIEYDGYYTSYGVWYASGPIAKHSTATFGNSNGYTITADSSYASFEADINVWVTANAYTCIPIPGTRGCLPTPWGTGTSVNFSVVLNYAPPPCTTSTSNVQTPSVQVIKPNRVC